MIIDCRKWSKLPDKGASERKVVFVDGVQVNQVWYVDTYDGYVKTHDVFCDGIPRALTDDNRGLLAGDPPLFEDEGGILSKTIYGRVELKPL